jgi:hypothetical protein
MSEQVTARELEFLRDCLPEVATVARRQLNRAAASLRNRRTGLEKTAEMLKEYIQDDLERAQAAIALNAITELGPKYAAAKFYLVRCMTPPMPSERAVAVAGQVLSQWSVLLSHLRAGMPLTQEAENIIIGDIARALDAELVRVLKIVEEEIYQNEPDLLPPLIDRIRGRASSLREAPNED